MNWRLRVPSVVYRLAVARAGNDHALAQLVAAWVSRYAQGEPMPDAPPSPPTPDRQD